MKMQWLKAMKRRAMKTQKNDPAKSKTPSNGNDNEMLSSLGDKKQYKIIMPKLSGGSFGEIYLSVAKDGSKNYIVKREKERPKKRMHLETEFEIMCYLGECDHIPNVYWHEVRGPFNYMVMEMVGPNLMELYQICSKHFNTYTIIQICKQMIDIFQFIHGFGIIHRDLKPENITVGSWPYDSGKIYLIDFGLSKQIFVNRDGEQHHIHEKNPGRVPRGSITGTVRYASINAHYGDQSRRDDLLSFGHIIMYFMCGKLPWMGTQAYTKREKYLKILKKKESQIDFYLTKEPYSSSLPKFFQKYMNQCHSYSFTQMPNYTYMQRLFHKALKRRGFETDDARPLEWESKQLLDQQWPPEYALVSNRPVSKQNTENIRNV